VGGHHLYRPTGCVPGGFNLLDFFDIPGAFFCGPPTVAGREMRRTRPLRRAVPVAPEGAGRRSGLAGHLGRHAGRHGRDVVTRTELESLPSLLRGTADTFSEMLQPIPTRLPSRLVINAEGTLEDGRSFLLHYNSHDDFSGNNVRSVRIDVW
jgi:hypothetical protein